MFSLFRRSRRDAREREPLLPRHNHDTPLQATLDDKLHSYQMVRALSRGYMPSNEQLVVHLRRLLSSDVLNPSVHGISYSGRALVRNTRELIEGLAAFLEHKNEGDQVQDFIWYLAKARLSVDTRDLGDRAARAKAKADTAGAYMSLKTVGTLLLTNSDFRIFLGDLTTVGREVFRDTAFALSSVSKDVGTKLAPSEQDQEAAKQADGNSKKPPSKDDFKDDAVEVSNVVGEGAAQVAEEARNSVKERISGQQRDTLIARLKGAVMNLRKRRDYTSSVSTLSVLLRRYLLVYSRALSETAQVVQDDTDRNPETDRALRNFWSFLTSLGNKDHWEEVEYAFRKVMDHAQNDPEFEKHVDEIGNLVQDALTDTSFFDDVEDRFVQLRHHDRHLTTESSFKDDVDTFLTKLRSALRSVAQDADVNNITHSLKHLLAILSPPNTNTNSELITDSINIFAPALVQAVQYIPIPRLEVSTPDADLLLENLILEPGRTVNRSSFLPYRFKLATLSEMEVRKGRVRTTSRLSTFVRISLSGLSLSASDVGYWLRAHSGILRFGSEGIASFHLDERGVDIELDVEIGRDRLESILSVRRVRVHIHRFDYTLRKTRFSFLAWLAKPLLRPMIRAAAEKQLAHAIKDACATFNREMVFARERLRATRVADPDDLWTFVKAVSARLVPRQSEDVDVRLGVEEPGKGVFKGVYAPGSLVKVWHEEGRGAGERVEEFREGGWRNDIFDVRRSGRGEAV